MRPLLVGQAPSRESEGRPAFSTSGRSATKLSALVGRPVLEAFDAANLLDRWPGRAGDKGDRFPIEEARLAARRICERRKHPILILVGKAVARAFGLGAAEYFEWEIVAGKLATTIPHPSGVNRWWNEPENERRAALFLRRLAGG